MSARSEEDADAGEDEDDSDSVDDEWAAYLIEGMFARRNTPGASTAECECGCGLRPRVVVVRKRRSTGC